MQRSKFLELPTSAASPPLSGAARHTFEQRRSIQADAQGCGVQFMVVLAEVYNWPYANFL
jgi:hypothetical protein